MRIRRAAVAVAAALFLGAGSARAQELADYDYANLSFRGVAVEAGYLWPDKVEPTPSYGVRFDLGYLGPAVRVTPSVTWWSSRMTAGEVGGLEERMDSLIARTQPGGPADPVRLGPIERTDVALALDAHMVWRVPYGFLTFAGAGASVHFLDGAGDAIADTFVEDLLDSVSAGFGVQAGVEVPLSGSVRLYGTGRLELLEDLRYAALRGGVQLHFGGAVPGEEGPR